MLMIYNHCRFTT